MNARPVPTTRIRNLFILLGLVLLLAVLLRVEWEEKHQDTGYTREAMDNHYLAVQRFLEARGHRVTVQLRAMNLTTLPSTEAVIIFRGTRSRMDSEQLDRLYQWVEAGGTLLLEANVPEQRGARKMERDYLLERIGIWPESQVFDPAEKKSTIPQAPGDNSKQDNHSKQNDSACSKPASLCDGAEIPISGQPLTACVTISRYMQHLVWRDGLAVTAAEPSDSAQFATLGIGKGRVMVATDLHFLENSSISDRDNAYFVDVFTHSRGDVWIVVRPGKPTWIPVAWDLYPWSISLFAIFAGLAAWHFAPRLGPVWVGTPSVWRSQYRDHLRNAGGFLWRHSGGTELLEKLQQDVLTRVTYCRRQMQQPTDADMVPHLSALTGLPTDRIRKALHALPDRHDSNAFIESIQTLQILRKTL